MHCATAKIERENRKVIGEALADFAGAQVLELEDDADAAYIAQVGAGARRWWFVVYINRLPENGEGAWGSELPWPGAPGEVSSDVDVYQIVGTTDRQLVLTRFRLRGRCHEGPGQTRRSKQRCPRHQ
jgi:hypothetical protein